ncbi:MAG: hypothetical protein AAF492_20450, partial [Verrucomicrobiota bacterium]
MKLLRQFGGVVGASLLGLSVANAPAATMAFFDFDAGGAATSLASVTDPLLTVSPVSVAGGVATDFGAGPASCAGPPAPVLPTLARVGGVGPP